MTNKTSVQQDIIADRAYRNGLMAGWNYGVSEDLDGFNLAVDNYSRNIRDAQGTANIPVREENK